MKLVASSRKRKRKSRIINEKIAVFASGNGSNFQVIRQRISGGVLSFQTIAVPIKARAADKSGTRPMLLKTQEFENKAGLRSSLVEL